MRHFGRPELRYFFLVYSVKYIIFKAERAGKYALIRGKMLGFWIMTVWTRWFMTSTKNDKFCHPHLSILKNEQKIYCRIKNNRIHKPVTNFKTPVPPLLSVGVLKVWSFRAFMGILLLVALFLFSSMLVY